MAGIILQVVALPRGVAPEQVPAASLTQLGGWLVISQWLLWSIMLAALAFYRLDRHQHQLNLATIQARDNDAR
jgi:hypothetical protein